jgi:hypothetical protein
MLETEEDEALFTTIKQLYILPTYMIPFLPQLLLKCLALSFGFGTLVPNTHTETPICHWTLDKKPRASET